MSITDELRAYVRGHSWKSLTAIADRIDAEYEKNMVDALLNDGLPMSDEVMAEHGWYRVLDADKQPIHIGDELDGYGYPNGGAYCKAILNEVMILAGPKDSSYRSWLMWDAAEVRHHHEPTIEDVLDEFASAYDRIGGEDEEHQKYLDLIAEYAAKLRLVNSEEQ